MGERTRRREETGEEGISPQATTDSGAHGLAAGNAAVARIAASVPHELAQRLARDPRLRAYYHALTAEARAEVDRGYVAYAARVRERRGEGWSHGGWLALGNARSGFANDGLVRGAPLVGGNDRAATAHGDVLESFSGLERKFQEASLERTRLIAALKDHPDDPTARARLDVVVGQLQEYEREMEANFGRCGDWAAEIRDLLTGLGLQHLVAGQAYTSNRGHTAAQLSLPQATEAIIFDPWKTGEPDVFLRSAWQH